MASAYVFSNKHVSVRQNLIKMVSRTARETTGWKEQSCRRLPVKALERATAAKEGQRFNCQDFCEPVTKVMIKN